MVSAYRSAKSEIKIDFRTYSPAVPFFMFGGNIRRDSIPNGRDIIKQLLLCDCVIIIILTVIGVF